MEQKGAPGLQILQTTTIAQDKWLTFRSRDFVDRLGDTHAWSYVERNSGRSAVVIIARDQRSKSIILIRQFRVPLAAWIYEFPAGLIDDGESPEHAALRELREETGYDGQLASISPALPTSSGLSSEYIYLAELNCAEPPGTSSLEGAEAIELLLLPDNAESISAFLNQVAANKEIIDAKLYSWLRGRLER